jgi:glucokinase
VTGPVADERRDAQRLFAHERRTVLTLDAGGTNFTFSAMAGGRETVPPLTLPARVDDLGACLDQIVAGFRQVRDAAAGVTGELATAGEGPAGAAGGPGNVGEVAALSFAFPGPADYPAGIIGELGNLPCFRGGVALGPMLAEEFGVPVFINNDGDLFTLGEALGGLLPEVNRRLAAAGSGKRFRNLLGVTLGTGFGGGIVRAGELYRGDNSAAGEIWLVRNKLDPDCCAEEGASLRAVRRAYARSAGISLDEAPDSKEIAAIAEERTAGDAAAAREAFRRLGEVAGDAIANALTLLDGLVVVGGGLAGAAPLFLPALVAELNGRFGERAAVLARLELAAFNLEDAADRERFFAERSRQVPVPRSARTVAYDPGKRTAVGLSRLGTGGAVALGAYAYALQALDAHAPS